MSLSSRLGSIGQTAARQFPVQVLHRSCYAWLSTRVCGPDFCCCRPRATSARNSSFLKEPFACCIDVSGGTGCGNRVFPVMIGALGVRCATSMTPGWIVKLSTGFVDGIPGRSLVFLTWRSRMSTISPFVSWETRKRPKMSHRMCFSRSIKPPTDSRSIGIQNPG